MQRKKNRILVVVCLLCLLLSSCATVGRDFSHQAVAQIKIGITSRDEVRRLFGSPWRIGIENGADTWTYGSYRYRIFKAPASSDLVVRFNPQGLVESFSFSTTESPEAKRD